MYTKDSRLAFSRKLFFPIYFSCFWRENFALNACKIHNLGNGGQIQRDLVGIWWILLQNPTFVTKIDLTSGPGGVRRCSWALEHRIFDSLSIYDSFGSIGTVLLLANRRYLKKFENCGVSGSGFYQPTLVPIVGEEQLAGLMPMMSVSLMSSL